MHKKTLKELAKFASGLIAADFLCGLWVYFSVIPPISFLGIVFTKQNIILWMAFDVIIFLFLVHYAWRVGDRERTSKEKIFHNIAGTIFALVAILHLSRLLFGWRFIIGSWLVPYWLNGLGVVITIFLAYLSFHIGTGRENNQSL